MYENIFLTDKNHKLIMRTLFEYFSKHYNYKVGYEEEELTYMMMKNIISKNPASRNDKPRPYIQGLLRKTVGTVKGIIESKLTEENGQSPQRDSEYQQRLEADKKLRAEQSLGNNKDVSNMFEQLNKERASHLQQTEKKDVPNFAEPLENNNAEISAKFEEINKERELEMRKTEELLNRDSNDIISSASINQPAPVNQSFNINESVNPSPIDEQTINTINNIENLNDAPKSMGQQLLIQKPKEFESLVNNAYKYNNNFIKRFNLVIDSRDRNTDDYPYAYKYQVDFDYIYKDIISIELVSANIPKTEYLINASNNKIYFSENGGSELEATIPTGNYTPTTLSTAIKTAMETVGADTYTVTADETLTNKYTITKSSGTLELFFVGGTETYGTSTRTIYKTSSIGPVIGFTKTDLSGSATHTGQNQFNLNGPSYVLLHIHNLDNLFGVHNSSVSKSFAKITLDTEQSDYKYFKSQQDYIIRKEMSPPLAKLAQLDIEFRNYDGSFYDFGGLEHCLYFKITTLNQNSGYFF
jgi:hypothetical protein